MILIALIFILVCVKQFVTKLKAVAVSFIICVTMFALLALPNTDAVIAKYNVGRYINGTLATVDIEATQELGSSAVPSLAELMKHLQHKDRDREEENLYNNLTIYLNDIANEIIETDKDIFSFTIPDALAEKALKDIGYLQEEKLSH